ncbi:MAG: NAD(+)/NADH kinase [Methanospirillum sp.]|uniref:NAD(+)/NADH kinase n=1 Tax=Methanospirillum sp. TaxID=45200 RepID=UPI002371AE91|nr:NAD(+)/NADH kinase [Methanospirillum sp.]MDD1728933.1 NAD(+)/NADH kinase [Methanospirillum sp.]
MDILIIIRIEDPRIRKYAEQLGCHLTNIGHHIRFGPENLHEGGDKLFDPAHPPDLVVVVGGDGTILLTAQHMPIQIPLIGVNWGEVGFLADLEPDEAFAFFDQMKVPIQTEQRMRISLAIDGRYTGDALNEALIVTDRPAKMLKFLIHINGVIAERFRADGLLISTPTGSTAYAMSAGGPIVDPRVEGFLMVPIAPFMLSNRPHLIDSSRTVRVTLEAEKPAKLVIDGQIICHIGEMSTIDITRSQHPALFVDAGENFFEKINRKLRHL